MPLRLCLFFLFIIPSLSLKAQENQASQDSAHSYTGRLLLVGTLMTATAIYDVETTFYGLRRGAQELNPIARHFVKGGRIPTYALKTGVILLNLYLTKLCLENEDQRFWWLPSTIVSTLWFFGGTYNLVIIRSLNF